MFSIFFCLLLWNYKNIIKKCILEFTPCNEKKAKIQCVEVHRKRCRYFMSYLVLVSRWFRDAAWVNAGVMKASELQTCSRDREGFSYTSCWNRRPTRNVSSSGSGAEAAPQQVQTFLRMMVEELEDLVCLLVLTLTSCSPDVPTFSAGCPFIVRRQWNAVDPLSDWSGQYVIHEITQRNETDPDLFLISCKYSVRIVDLPVQGALVYRLSGSSCRTFSFSFFLSSSCISVISMFQRNHWIRMVFVYICGPSVHLEAVGDLWDSRLLKLYNEVGRIW